MTSAALPAALEAHAMERFEAYRERAAQSGVVAHAFDALPGDTARVFAVSRFVAQTCRRDPAMLADLVDSGDLGRAYAHGDMAARVERALAGVTSEADLHRAIRLLRRREMVRIAWRDIGGLAELDEVVADTSALAEAAVESVLEWLDRSQGERLGVPEATEAQRAHLVVFALGKLGAGELNFSSDIDLIFAYTETGDTRGGRRTVSNHEYFLRLGRQLIKALSEQTEHGMVFRVDMRLRPFGEGGPLVVSLAALEDYYQHHGRDWERYALIRMRPIGGPVEAGEALIKRLRPFVYRRYLDFSTLESLRDMKRLIVDEVTRKGFTENVKLGPGGIREIEFVGQAFQMVRGGRIRELRDRRILVVLDRLAELGYLPAYAVRELVEAYRFLRDTEHRLQQMDDRQAHLLPQDAQTRLVVAAGMGFATWEAFDTVIKHHREHVNAHFDQVFGADQEEAPVVAEPLTNVWNGKLGADDAHARLAEAGFPDPAAAYDHLTRFAQSYAIRLLDTRGAERLSRLMPDLLRAVATQDAPTDTLTRVCGIIETVARRSVYLALLCERPLALSQLVRLCAASPWIARHLGRHPLLLDELLDARTLYAPLDRVGLRRELESRLANIEGDQEQEMEALRQFKHASVLRVAASDVSSELSLMMVSDHLTEIAEVTLERVLDLAWRDVSARHGVPAEAAGDPARPAGLAIIAYGKLGGIELGYGSDLDLVFVHGGAGPDALTEGPRPVERSVFMARVAQRAIHYLGAHTAEGVLYEVDSRLRPSGGKGVLVNSFDGYTAYLQQDAWTWEHQALVRARVVAGDPEMRERFAALRRSVLLGPRDPETLRTEVLDMRRKMRTALGSGNREGFDLKQDPGGIADIEFLVQYGVLRWSQTLGTYLEYTDNIRLLEGFAKVGVMAPNDAASLTDAYRAFRARVHAQSLQEDSGAVGDSDLREHREQVTRLWTEWMES